MEQLLLYVASASGVVGAIMGAVKTVWTPKVKWLYWIPASILSAASAYVVMVLAEVAFVWYLWLISGLLIASFELLVQNGWWPQIKEHLPKILSAIFKK